MLLLRLALFLLLFQTASLFADTAAVLPFANRTAVANPVQASLDWIGESIAETVRDAIGSRGVVTLSRVEIEDAYHQLNLRTLSLLTEASMLKIGEALDAEQVVYGSFEFLPDPAAAHGIADGSLKITAHIFDRRRFKQSSEFIESGNLEDLPTLEAHLAWRALVHLRRPQQHAPRRPGADRPGPRRHRRGHRQHLRRSLPGGLQGD